MTTYGILKVQTRSLVKAKPIGGEASLQLVDDVDTDGLGVGDWRRCLVASVRLRHELSISVDIVVTGTDERIANILDRVVGSVDLYTILHSL